MCFSFFKNLADRGLCKDILIRNKHKVYWFQGWQSAFADAAI